jgi:DNA-binding MarR family transcriptional regulator
MKSHHPAMRPPSEAEVAAWYAVGRNYHRCEAVLAARVAPLGLTVTEHEVLQQLLHAPGLSQQRLAGRVFTAKSHLSGVVRDLEARGLLMRSNDPADARAWCLALTRAGQGLARRAEAVQTALIGAMGSGVAADDFVRFAAVLDVTERNLMAIQSAAD